MPKHTHSIPVKPPADRTFDFKRLERLQLLADTRNCFAHYAYPGRLPTAVLLDWLHSRPARSWNLRGPITAARFAWLLASFHIYPRPQRIGRSSPARGYRLHDFVEHWQTHFGFDPASVTHSTESEIANNDADCHSVTDSRAFSERRDVACNVSPCIEGAVGAHELESSRQQPGSDSSVTDTSESEIPNKNAGCHSVTDSGTVF